MTRDGGRERRTALLPYCDQNARCIDDSYASGRGDGRDTEKERGTHQMKITPCYRAVSARSGFAPTRVMCRSEGVSKRRDTELELPYYQPATHMPIMRRRSYASEGGGVAATGCQRCYRTVTRMPVLHRRWLCVGHRGVARLGA